MTGGNDHAADAPIDSAAEIARDMRQDRADEHSAERSKERDQYSGPCAKDQARQHVAAETVGSEEITRIAAVGPGRRSEDRKQILISWIVRRDPSGKDRAERDAADHTERDQNAGRAQRTG
jgi:hypothetical protein